jgi:hypothetical protein
VEVGILLSLVAKNVPKETIRQTKLMV